MRQIFSHLSTESTTNTGLAAALTAIGIPLSHQPIAQIAGDGIKGERTIWFFEPASLCGKHATKDMIAAWNDEAWHMKNPEHPFAYIKCALANREKLVDKVKHNIALACVKRRGKIALIPMNASPQEQDMYLRNI